MKIGKITIYKNPKIQVLIDDYERRLKTARTELDNKEISLQDEMRIGIKASCYKEFIAKLKRIK